MECIETMRSELCVQFQYKRDKADVIPLDEVEDTYMTMQFSLHICAISHDLLSKVKYPLYSSYSVINDGSKYKRLHTFYFYDDGTGLIRHLNC